MIEQPQVPIGQHGTASVSVFTQGQVIPAPQPAPPRRPSTLASREYVHQVERDLRHLISPDDAPELADYIASELERVGGSDARLVFTVDGVGPVCSWCWAPGGLCRHIVGGASEHVQSSGVADT